MNKLIKNLAPLVLVVFLFSTIIGTSWGNEKVEVRCTITDKMWRAWFGLIYPNSTIIVGIHAKYKGEILNDIQLIEPASFKLIERQENVNFLTSNSPETIFKLKSPSKTGNYNLVFTGKTSQNELTTFVRNIEIKDYHPIVTLGGLLISVAFISIMFAAMGGQLK